ncbi:MAG TPA: AraC family transcriptional regulator, partial [Saprospiraceae bacterium]|nr:AraC family transcriptional regulator [Saprospiraceae bacterium]
MMILNKSVAVLPFVNISSDADNEYFSDGITEEIINALTTVQGLKVIARTSSFAFKGKNMDVRTIGRQLGVSTVLEGSVRKVEKRIRITAQLIRTDDGTHLWSKNFDRELQDIFTLQDEISLLIAEKIRENFGHLEIQRHLVEAPTKNIEAYNLYLKGRYHQLKWNKKDLLKAVEYYKMSIAEDSSFSFPYFGAGLSLGILAGWEFMPYDEGITSADEFLKAGLQKDDKNYLGFFALATVSFWGKWNFNKGYDYFIKALKHSPSFTDIEEGLAELYTANGEFDKALNHANHILILSPLSPNHYYTKANIFYLQNDFENAI